MINLTANDSIDTVELDLTARAERIAAALQAEGFIARVWQGGSGALRVYVARTLARRRQDMGYIDVGATISVCVDRARGTIESIVSRVQ